MFTRDERRALLFLAAVTAAGGVIRAVRGGPDKPAAAAVAPHLAGEDLVRQAALSRRAEALQRPLEPGERVDVDRATAPELARIPRVGRRLAARIVADRSAHGPFGSLAGLARVPGVGAALRRDLEPFVTFSAGPPAAAAVAPGSPVPRAAGPAAALAAESVPPRKAGAACAGPIAVNRATREELTCLPGIGTVLAGRIVADREAHGTFREIGDLARVPGLGPGRIARLRGRITIP